MSAQSDFEGVVKALNRREVQFLVIGGFAVVNYGHIRNTQDLDLYVRPSPENARKAVAALKDMGLNAPEICEESFTLDNGISLGEGMVKVDLITFVPGVSDAELWQHKAPGLFSGERVYFISLDDLIKNKRTVGRGQDLVDAQFLEDAKRKGTQG